MQLNQKYPSYNYLNPYKSFYPFQKITIKSFLQGINKNVTKYVKKKDNTRIMAKFN